MTTCNASVPENHENTLMFYFCRIFLLLLSTIYTLFHWEQVWITQIDNVEGKQHILVLEKNVFWKIIWCPFATMNMNGNWKSNVDDIYVQMLRVLVVELTIKCVSLFDGKCATKWKNVIFYSLSGNHIKCRLKLLYNSRGKLLQQQFLQYMIIQSSIANISYKSEKFNYTFM